MRKQSYSAKVQQKKNRETKNKKRKQKKKRKKGKQNKTKKKKARGTVFPCLATGGILLSFLHVSLIILTTNNIYQINAATAIDI